MLGSGIAAVTAPFAPRPGARGGDTNPARGSAEAPIDTTRPTTGQTTGSITGGSDTRTSITSLIKPALSSEAIRNLAVSQSTETASPGGIGEDETSPDARPVGHNAEEPSSDGLSADEREIVRKMAARDREVRQHEQAHASAGGAQAGSPSFSYQIGPDGKRYAVSGEVPIDTAPVPDDPAATIAKMSVVISAALAPASPSMPDSRIAAQAASTRLEAIAELAASRGGVPDGDADNKTDSKAVGQSDNRSSKTDAAFPTSTPDDPHLTGQLFTRLDRPEPGHELSRVA